MDGVNHHWGSSYRFRSKRRAALSLSQVFEVEFDDDQVEEDDEEEEK